MRLEIGHTVKTNYNTGPYQIVEIIRDCICPEYLDEDESPSAPHMHLTCRDQDRRGKFYLNGYDENTLKNVWSNDYLIICENSKPVQMTCF